MFARITFTLLALISFSVAAETPPPPVLTSPNFELPYACAYTFAGTTSPDAIPNRAIEFHRHSAVANAVLVSAPGIVRTVRDLGYGSIGRYIVVDHGGGWSTTYANLADIEVHANQRVDGGQRLGMIGRLGNAVTSYLYYMQSKNGFPEVVRFNGTWAKYYGERDYTSTTHCGTAGPVSGQVDLGSGQSGFVWVRNDTAPRAQPIGDFFQNSRVTVQCQLTGSNYLAGPTDAPSPDGSELWYRISFNDGIGYVPAPQVRLAYAAKAPICR